MISSKRFQALAVLAFCFGLIPADGKTAVFKAAGDKRNLVTFETQAPLESIVGRTSAVSARLELDPGNPTGAKARFEVDLASLDTGIGMRDQHMRSPQYLDTEKYPTAVFDLLEVKIGKGAVLTDGKPLELVALGNFTVHGVTRKIMAKVKATYFKESEATRTRLPGDLLRIVATFNISLADFGIERPEMMLLRVGESVEIKLDVFAAATP